ncbi:HAMP domain-containing sensor histidine kinase [Hymenobacter saemangeumensis]
MRSLLLALLLTTGLLAETAWAQVPASAPATDSLRRLLATAPADTNRLNILLQLCSQAPPEMDVQPYAREGLQLAQRLRSREKELTFLSVLNLANYRRQDYPAAARYAQELMRKALQPPAEPLFAAQALTNLGNIAGAEGNYAEARRYFWQGVRLAESAPPTPRRLRILAYGYSNLTGGYSFQLQESSTRPDSLIERMRYCIRQNIRLAKELRATGDERSYRGHLANAWDALADLADLNHRLDSALYYKRLALKSFRELGDARLVMTRQQHLANLELSAGNAATAAALARESKQAAHAMGSPVDEAYAAETLAQALDAQGRSHEAFQTLRRSYALRDTALGAEKRAALAQLQVSFETERKEARIRELTQQQKLRQVEAERQQQRLWTLAAVLGVVGLALAVAGVLYWRLRRSRAQLAALAASKDRLYALVAHDLRGPVQALDGLGNMIAYYLRRADLAALTQLPPLVSQAVTSVNQLLDNLLHWAASQTGELSFQPSPQPLALLLNECASLWSTTALANQVELRVAPVAEDATLWADPQMLRTVLRNLVGNALKFTPTGGTVLLAAEPAGDDGQYLRITDSGPGISPDDIATLLGPENGKKRLRRPGVRGEQGTGLGLRLCQLFMRRHGGKLELLSQPGSGTTAQLWFPAPR